MTLRSEAPSPQLPVAKVTDGNVSLRGVVGADTDGLYRLALDPRVLERWRYRGATPSPEDFRKNLWAGVLAQFVVEVSAGNSSSRAGLVTLYNANHRNRIAYIGALADPVFEKTGAILTGLELLIDYAFTNWDFRKLYFEAAEWNFYLFNSGAGRVFREEGRLVGYEYWDGRYWDMVIGSISRESWIERDNLARKRHALAQQLMGLAVSPGRDAGDRIPRAELPIATCETVLAILGEILGRPVALDDEIEKLGADSLHMVEIEAALELLTGTELTIMPGDGASGITARNIYLAVCERSSMPLRAESGDASQ